jgi:hypothetical protein
MNKIIPEKLILGEIKEKLNYIILKKTIDVTSIKPTDLRKITDSSEISDMRKVNDLVGIISKNTQSFENSKKIESRRKFHEVILEIDSNNENAWQNIGNAYFVLDNSKKAIYDKSGQ